MSVPIKDGIADWLSGAAQRHRQALPQISPTLKVVTIADTEAVSELPVVVDTQQPVSGFTCVIQYEDAMRLVVCRRHDLIGDQGYVGGICHSARGYRQFRQDKIAAVFDAQTGELIGDGGFFDRFAVDGRRERSPTWGLPPSQRYTLSCGLNVLAFMSRCDGQWHPLETEVIERFVCALWLRKEWVGEPPMAEILAHAERLSPDWDVVCQALKHYAVSSISTGILKRAVSDLIAADGVICEAEHQWALELVQVMSSFEVTPPRQDSIDLHFDEDSLRRRGLDAAG